MHCTMSIVRRPNMRLLWLLRHLWQDLDPCGEPTICPRCNVLIPFCRPSLKTTISWFIFWFQSLKDIFGLFRTSFSFVQDLQRALTNAGSDECIIEASYCLDLLSNAINRCQGCSLGFFPETETQDLCFFEMGAGERALALHPDPRAGGSQQWNQGLCSSPQWCTHQNFETGEVEKDAIEITWGCREEFQVFDNTCGIFRLTMQDWQQG